MTKLSQAFCAKSIECGCAPVLLEVGLVPPMFFCEGWNLTDLTAETESADSGGGEYGDTVPSSEDSGGGDITVNFDQDCADRLAKALSETSCDLLIPEFGCGDFCKLYYGTRFEGEPCQTSADCAQGLVCLDECRDPCRLETVGEGESCEFALCGPGLECVESVDGGAPPTCLGPGADACGDGTCTSDEWCDNNGMVPECVPLVAPGGECSGHVQCTTLFCPAGFCAELPGEGEACSEQGTCSEGLICLGRGPELPGTCTLVAPLCLTVLEIPFLLGAQPYVPYYYY